MSRLEELMKQYCPDGVKYKKICDIGVFLKGMTGVSKKWEETGNCRFIDYKNVYNNLKIDVSNIPYATVKNYNNQTILKTGDILFTSASETPDECAISSVIESQLPDNIFLDDHLFGVRFDKSIINATYINYYCRSADFRKKVNKTVRGVTRYYISMPDFAEIVVPVPPLEVQREIVRILDSFTFLSAELSAELQARKKQYEYYRDSLLTQKGNKTSIKDLIEVADVFDSLHQTPSYVANGYNMIRVQDIKSGYVDSNNTLKVEENIWRLFTNKYKPQFNDIVVSRVGSYGNFALIPNDKCCLGQNVALIHPKINPKYLYHVLSSNLTKKWIENNVKGSSQKSLSLADIKRMPVLYLEESMQKKIADVLDNFESICNDLNIGLPAEIEARQKQYEYYRDMLLTFAETGDIMPQTDRQTSNN